MDSEDVEPLSDAEIELVEKQIQRFSLPPSNWQRRLLATLRQRTNERELERYWVDKAMEERDAALQRAEAAEAQLAERNSSTTVAAVEAMVRANDRAAFTRGIE